MALEGMMVDLALRVLSLGVNVVLDFGLWSRSEREELRARAESIGARSELHFLDVPLVVLLARLELRNADLPAGTFAIHEEELRLWSTWLEAPGADELIPREAPILPAS
jgi:predicted kinase